jgi:hypothetical protein
MSTPRTLVPKVNKMKVELLEVHNPFTYLKINLFFTHSDAKGYLQRFLFGLGTINVMKWLHYWTMDDSIS